MCETCGHITTLSAVQRNQYDPTHTTTLRNLFARDMRRRFDELVKVVRVSVDEQDCFGLKGGGQSPETTGFQTYQMTPAGAGAFQFARSEEKVRAFNRWFQQQTQAGILQVSEYQQIGSSIEASWTNKYIQDSYKRGVIRARYELGKAGFDVPGMSATGGVEASMATPFHAERVGLLYSRVFEELRGITTQMDTQISRVLSQGLADGDNPRLLARKLVATINGSGMGELGLTDTIGRFIPARRRAEIMARTELIRAHHQANIQEYKNWRVEQVYVRAEFLTAGDSRVCNQCSSIAALGKTYTLEEIQNMIPVHPQCRCIALPTKGMSKEESMEKELKIKDETEYDTLHRYIPTEYLFNKERQALAKKAVKTVLDDLHLAGKDISVVADMKIFGSFITKKKIPGDIDVAIFRKDWVKRSSIMDHIPKVDVLKLSNDAYGKDKFNYILHYTRKQ